MEEGKAFLGGMCCVDSVPFLLSVCLFVWMGDGDEDINFVFCFCVFGLKILGQLGLIKTWSVLFLPQWAY